MGELFLLLVVVIGKAINSALEWFSLRSVRSRRYGLILIFLAVVAVSGRVSLWDSERGLVWDPLRVFFFWLTVISVTLLVATAAVQGR